jgi:uncharacterized protein (TIGR02757 family)
MHYRSIYELLEIKYREYNRPDFIENDPISIPHLFSKKENIEIAGFITSMISWGQRPMIIKNAFRLVGLMDNDLYSFILNASEQEISGLNFCHRTFNSSDLQYLVYSIRNIYIKYGGLEKLITDNYIKLRDIKLTLIAFHDVFFESDILPRTKKHIADVSRNASAKRLNMFLRWMVRDDNNGVDFGLWKGIPSSALYIPLDVHSGSIARELGILKRKQDNWKAVHELTSVLREFDPHDPVKYDFALFGMGVNRKKF